MEVPRVEHITDKQNFYSISDDRGVFWFSYSTLIALDRPHEELLIRENDWGPTTGKHLNFINEDKSIRMNGKDFEEEIYAL